MNTCPGCHQSIPRPGVEPVKVLGVLTCGLPECAHAAAAAELAEELGES